MHRRSFVALLAAALATPPLMARATEDLPWARRNFEPIDQQASVSGIHPLARAFADEAAARAEIDALATLGHSAPPAGTPEAFQPITILPSPPDISLPAAMRRYDGPAVFPEHQPGSLPYVTIDVQRGVWVVSLMVRGEDEEELIALATDLMRVMIAYPIPTSVPNQNQTGRRTGGIWDLLLHEADAPDGFRLYQEADASEVVNFDA